ncbi:MAG: hypothetical protein PWP37_103 [Thermotogota bacterium]|nr:hypothetical protein [Thermotogota bacterium]
MTSKWWKDSRFYAAAFIFAYGLLLFILGLLFKRIFGIIVAATGIVLLVEPIGRFIQRFIKNRRASIILALLVFYSFLVLVTVTLTPSILKETNSLITLIRDFFEKQPWEELRLFKDYPNLKDIVNNLAQAIEPKLFDIITSFITQLPTQIPGVIGFIFFVVLCSVYGAFYIEQIRQSLRIFFPKSIREDAGKFVELTYTSLQRYIVAVTVSAILTAVSMGAFLKIIGVNYYLSLGAWAFLTNYIPIVGVFLEMIPMVVVIIPAGATALIWFLIVTLIVHGAAFIIFLKVMYGYPRLNPIIMILAIILVTELFGVAGAFIAVPMAIVARDYWMEFVKPFFEES